MPIILRKLPTKYDFNSTQDKRVSHITLWLHGNYLVTKAMRYVAVLKKLHTKYDLNSTQDKRIIYITLWLPW